MITPTIGRRVWFRPVTEIDLATLRLNDDKQACYAGVVYVWNDRMVNLDVTDHNGLHYAFRSVLLVQEGDPVPLGQSYCEWMPYQQGQAKQQADVGTTAAAPPDYRDRVLLERDRVNGDLEKLTAFLSSDKLSTVDAVDIELMHAQAAAMKDYRDILDDRIERFAPAVSSL